MRISRPLLKLLLFLLADSFCILLLFSFVKFVLFFKLTNTFGVKPVEIIYQIFILLIFIFYIISVIKTIRYFYIIIPVVIISSYYVIKLGFIGYMAITGKWL